MAVMKARHRVLQSYEKVFRTEAGEVVLNDLIKRHRVLGSTYSTTEADGMARAIEMARAEGERNAILGILFHLKMTYKDIDKLVEDESEYERSQFDRSGITAIAE